MVHLHKPMLGANDARAWILGLAEIACVFVVLYFLFGGGEPS